MAIETQIENPAVTMVERTRSVWWASLDGAPYSVEAERETVHLDANNALVGYAQVGAKVIRPFASVKDETVDVNGTTIAVAELVEAQRILIDRWHAEDLEPPPPSDPPPP